MEWKKLKSVIASIPITGIKDWLRKLQKRPEKIGFEKYGFDRMISIIEPENTASIRVAGKNGMRYEKDAVFSGSVAVRIYSVSPPFDVKL